MGRRILRVTLALTSIAAVLGALAGGIDAWLAFYFAAWIAFGAYAMASIDDDLARERFTPPEAGSDRAWLRAIRLVALAHLVIGALDSGRWHLAPVPDAVRAVALAGMVGGAILVVRSMRANRFFSPVVRLQTERGHRLVDSGPYGRIRHPGYLGMIISVPCSALALGSWLSFALAAVYAGLILRRVCFEDAFLQAHLEGYKDYARRVTSRVIPGAW